MSLKRKNNENNYLNPQACVFCGSAEVNEVLLGMFLVSDAFRVHSNCLFFASGLSQRGTNLDEFLGFLVPDIEAEARRGKKLFCSYCKKRGATVGCCVTACKKSFHLNCGIQNGSLHEFFDSFLSYCKQHKPTQTPVVPDEYYCHICSEDIKPDEVESCLYSPCCSKKLFHKICLQKYALSAGLYFIKCPLCNNKGQFIEEMQKYGINIPEKDASWELEENAYDELLTRPECDAPNCMCPRGRNYCALRKSGWILVVCSYCGFHARHKNCGNIKSEEDRWLCEECVDLDEKIIKNKALSEIGNKSGLCTSNLSLSPKVVLEDCLTAKSSLHPDTHYDTLLNSAKASQKKEIYQTYVSATMPPVNSEKIELDNTVNSSSVQLPEIITNDNMDICEPIVPGPSFCGFTNAPRRMSVVSREPNLRDIKNVTHDSQVKRIKNSLKTRASGKVTKKQKTGNQFLKGNQSLITSFFGCNNEKNIRL